MEGCFLGNGERLNFSNMHQFPTSDPVVWNIDEGWCVLFVVQIINHKSRDRKLFKYVAIIAIVAINHY
jgi:hypothetical protein